MSAPAPSRLVLTDHDSLLDLGRYAARARALDADGAVRLQAVGSVLAAWVGVLPGTGLLGTGTTMVLSPDSEFFRYFRSPHGNAAPAAPAVPPAAPQATGAIPGPTPSETTGANP